MVSERRIHHTGCLVSVRPLFPASNWRVMMRFMCQSACPISQDEVWMPMETSVGCSYSNCALNSTCYAFYYLFNTNRMCMNASLFCLFDLLFLDSFLFYCILHVRVFRTGGSESKSLHSDWVASLMFSAPVPIFFRHFSLMLQTNQDTILPHSVCSHATYLFQLTRCRPKPCIRSVTFTLTETGYSFEIFINIYQVKRCPIPKGRNFNAYRHEKVNSVLTFQSLMYSYRKPWKCHDIGYFTEIRNRHRRITTFKGCCLKLVLLISVQQRWYYSYNCKKLHLQLIDI
jgi:hypothetical protein